MAIHIVVRFAAYGGVMKGRNGVVSETEDTTQNMSRSLGNSSLTLLLGKGLVAADGGASMSLSRLIVGSISSFQSVRLRTRLEYL